MKALHELLDDWENGSLSREDLEQLKHLLSDPAARAELRQELAFYGMLNEALGIYAISPEAEAALGKGILRMSSLAAISLLWERWMPARLRSVRGIVAGCAILAGLAGLAIWFQYPRSVASISQAGNGLLIRHAGKELRARPETKVFSGDSIRSSQFESAGLTWNKEQTRLFLAPGTEIKVTKRWQGKEITLAGGELKAIVAKQPARRPLIVKSPQAVAKVIGTRFTFSALTNGTRLEVVEGIVEFKELGTNRPALKVSAGEYAMTGSNVSSQVKKIDGMLWWDVWVAGAMPLSNDAPVRSTSLNQDYVSNARTFMWSYPFLTDKSKKYRERVRGILTPKETGDYVFWMMSMGASELWLSTDASPSNRVLVASTPAPASGAPLEATWNFFRDPKRDQSSMRDIPWNKFPSQKSQPVKLVAGQRYYLESLHEVAISDSIAVLWAKPGEDTVLPSGVIPGQFFSPLKE